MRTTPRTLQQHLDAFIAARQHDRTGPEALARFRDLVWFYYRTRRRSLPWRRTRSHYKVYVSEIMLQQTQVDRVARKFTEFVEIFPSFEALARASLREVLAAWQGLGYNRRALNLKRAAEVVVTEHGGRLPRRPEALARLPGIGAATAASIAAFAFNQPAVFIETNIRSVFIHCFLPDCDAVPDEELRPLIAATLDRQSPRRWYNALMDFGTWLKAEHGNPSRRSRHHRGQAAFEGSDRQVRGAVLRTLTRGGALSAEDLSAQVECEYARVQRVAEALAAEGFVCYACGRWSLNE
jgi:A/G-specific adenine glycosylase